MSGDEILGSHFSSERTLSRIAASVRTGAVVMVAMFLPSFKIVIACRQAGASYSCTHGASRRIAYTTRFWPCKWSVDCREIDGSVDAMADAGRERANGNEGIHPRWHHSCLRHPP